MSEKSPWNEQLAGILIKALIGGGAGSIITLVSSSELPKIALGAGLGGIGMAVYAFVEPIAKRANKGLGQAGDATATAIETVTGHAIAKLTSVEDRYFEAQALDCQYCHTEGMPKFGELFAPMLAKVYVPLELDRSAFKPGLVGDLAEVDGIDLAPSRGLDIWKVLSLTERDLVYRRLVILAWGGYGKTTLLRHLAFTYGRNLQDSKLPRLIPILLLLREYREELSQDTALNLPDLITQKHIAKLPDGCELKMPPDWAKTILKRGRALVMIDGFDEVHKAQRPKIAKWLNQQMQDYRESTFILTSRPKAFQEQDPNQDTVELDTILWIRDFNKEQREQFVQQWYWCQEYFYHGKEDTPDVRNEAKRSADALLAQIELRPELQALAKNPLLLNMMAAFHRRFPSAELPRRKVELYQEICLLQLRDRPGARRIEAVLETDEALIILQMLALEMMQHREERVIKSVVLERFTQYLTAQAETVLALDFLNYIEQISELLVQREPEEYEFSHLSFQEYLAAREIVRLKQENLLYDYFEDGWWKPTILLYASHVKPETLIKAMLEKDANDLAYLCCKETTKQIPPDLASQIQLSRYAKLEKLLKTEQWKKADEETYRLMITAIGKEEGQWFEPEEMLEFPSEELETIDRLWVKYSNGHFGFSIQKQIYLEHGGILDGNYYKEVWEKFCCATGWMEIRKYVELSFSSSAPRGHLPWVGGYVGFIWVNGVAVWWCLSLFSHQNL
jgi:GUN4-like/NACHT domain